MTPLRLTALTILASCLIIGTGLSWIERIRTRTAATRAENDLLHARLTTAQTDMARAATLQKQILGSREQLRTMDIASITPDDETFTRGYREITTMATASGLEVLTIIESTDKPPIPEPGPNGPWLTPYRLSAELRGTEASALRFATAIEQANPHVAFHHFSILNNRPGEPPMIFVTLEWLAWNGNDKAAAIRAWREPAN